MRAFITGISGQDGAYLAQFLLDKGYEVFGGARRTASGELWRLKRLGIADKVEVIDLEMTEYESIRRAVLKVVPNEIYNLAAQSFVGSSFETPLYTGDVDGTGVARLLEVIRGTRIRMYQASTSEMFGATPPPQSEVTPFSPRSPYACAKAYAHHMCQLYRNAYNTRVSCGILFNHESPLRGEEFVTQKIAREIRGTIRLGNLDSRRDWGHAKDYVRAMWLMLQSEPDDYVVATGVSHSVRDFLEAAGRAAGVEPKVEIDPRFFRPAEVDYLLGDPSKIKDGLGWEPEISFEELVQEMVDAHETLSETGSGIG